MIEITTSLGFQVAHPDLLIHRLDAEEDRTYVSYDKKIVHHTCERMGSDYEELFCTGGLFYVSAATRLENGSQNYYGYTYACQRHLRAVALAMCVTLEERSLSREYDLWQDSLHEEAQTDLSGQQAAEVEGA